MKRHDRVVRVLASIITQITGTRVHIERRTAEIRRIFRGRLQEGQMDLLVTDIMGARTYIDVTIVSPIVHTAYHLAAAAKKPGYAALRAEYGKRQRYPIPNLIPFVLELGGRPGPTALRFVRELFKVEGSTRSQTIADVWATISSTLQSSIADQLHAAHQPLTPAHQTAPTPASDPSITPTAPEASTPEVGVTQLDSISQLSP